MAGCRVPLEERFWKNVRKTESCWLWTAGTRPRGWYGYVWQDGKTVSAPRFAWELIRGPIPAGLWVLHNCPGGDNPLCVNPDHLWLGTRADNNRDKASKGRSPDVRGEKNFSAKLTEPEIRLIRLMSRGGIARSMIADIFGIVRQTVDKIVHRHRWTHLP